MVSSRLGGLKQMELQSQGWATRQMAIQQGLVPTERYAQETEQIINTELNPNGNE